MKLVWCGETASKAYIDTVQSCGILEESSVAELVSAMAAGWNVNLIVETWSKGEDITISIGLAVARVHTGGRHLCIVKDENTKVKYLQALGNIGELTEVHIGEPEAVMEGMENVDFLVMDSKINDSVNILRVAKFDHQGAVLVSKNAKWRNVLEGGERRLVRSLFFPIGEGLGIAHVAASGENSSSSKTSKRRWYKIIDRDTGVEHVVRR